MNILNHIDLSLFLEPNKSIMLGIYRFVKRVTSFFTKLLCFELPLPEFPDDRLKIVNFFSNERISAFFFF